MRNEVDTAILGMRFRTIKDTLNAYYSYIS